MKEVLGRHPGFHVERYNINEPRNVELLVDMQIAYDVPDDAWGGTSAVFVGRHWWTEREKFEAEFEDAGRSDKRTAEILIKKSDVTKPERGDQITNADGDAFVVLSTLRSDAAFHVVSAIEKTRKTLGDFER